MVYNAMKLFMEINPQLFDDALMIIPNIRTTPKLEKPHGQTSGRFLKAS